MEIRVGQVTHYYNGIGVAVLDLSGELKTGDRISILGRHTEFEQVVGSMEVDHQKIASAAPGMEVAIKVIEVVRQGDTVYRLQEE